jgi:FkbM family methyltransferase
MIGLIRHASLRLRKHPTLGRYALRAVPDIKWTVDIGGLGAFKIRLRRNRSFWLREPLESERFPFAMLRQMVKPGDVVYDAGANLGLYARYLIQGLHAGHVVAFEPMPDNRSLLTENVALAGIDRQVTLLPMALADEDGTVEFQVDDVQSASGTLDKVTGGEPCVCRRNLGLGPRTTKVLCRRLDTVIPELGLPLPDMIKIDVEGAEALLLRGAERLLREHSPMLLIELHGIQEIRDVLGLLDTMGYAVAGKVDPRIHPSGYGRVDASMSPLIQGQYDIHFMVAAKDPADLPAAATTADMP